MQFHVEPCNVTSSADAAARGQADVPPFRAQMGRQTLKRALPLPGATSPSCTTYHPPDSFEQKRRIHQSLVLQQCKIRKFPLQSESILISILESLNTVVAMKAGHHFRDG